MGGVMFLPCCSTWGQTMVEVMKIMVTSFKRSQAGTAAPSAANPAAGHRQPTPLTQPTADPDSSGDTQTQFCLGLCGVSLTLTLTLSPNPNP